MAEEIDIININRQSHPEIWAILDGELAQTGRGAGTIICYLIEADKLLQKTDEILEKSTSLNFAEIVEIRREISKAKKRLKLLNKFLLDYQQIQYVRPNF